MLSAYSTFRDTYSYNYYEFSHNIKWHTVKRRFRRKKDRGDIAGALVDAVTVSDIESCVDPDDGRIAFDDILQSSHKGTLRRQIAPRHEDLGAS